MVNLNTKPKKRHKGSVNLGVVTPDDMNAVKEFEGKEVWFSVQPYREYKQRSNNENRYYWGVVVKILGEELGYPSDQMHEAIKYHFLAETAEVNVEVNNEKKKKIIVIPGSTAGLSTSDFETLMSKIRNWASQELGIWIPVPNEVPFDY